MKKICILVAIIMFLGYCDYSIADSNITFCKRQYSSTLNRTLSDDLSFAENQIFNKNYKNESFENRLDRLELKVYGAIQDGNTLKRIANIKDALTNVSQGGKGLQYSNKLFDLAGNAISSSNWSIGDNNYYPQYYSYAYNNNNRYSHRIPRQRHYHSHRISPKNYGYNYNSNPIGNGNFTKNYSIGTGIKILNDD